jgi:hypothetical protein
MEIQQNPNADSVTQARNLVARAAKGVEQLEDMASQAFCRLAAITGMLARLEELAESGDPEAVVAAALDAATVCREARVLLHYLDSHEWTSARVVADGRSRTRPRARVSGGMVCGG